MTKTQRDVLAIIGVPTMYALILRWVHGTGWNEMFGLMSIAFLFLVPVVVGLLTVYLSPIEKVKHFGFRILMPWVPIFVFFGITLALAWEGWACWLMVLPLFLIAASIGGILGGALKRRRHQHLQVSLVLLLPLLIGPLEQKIEKIPGVYKVDTHIDIKAPAPIIWKHVTRVSEIPLEHDKGYLTRFLGFPRPLKAELNFEGVGAYREAIFSKGLVFHETVTHYEHNKKMVFRIKAYPHEIPSTTMDEHIVIGGDYFDVLDGTYELEALPNGTYRLHLYSHFKMNTTFNFYAGWWGTLIMKDIQNNILQIQKKRAEGK
jgi:hypothetical protein